MRLHQIILPVLSAILAVCPCFAQTTGTSDLTFERTVWDFGAIEETDGPVSYTFKFVNNGSSPVVIEQVLVSCGCTTPEYTRKPIMPGDAGEMKITFDPADRPGKFNKDIRIISGKGKNRDKLTVTGQVHGRPRSVEEDYPYQLSGGLRLERLDANFSYVERDKPYSMVVGYANNSGKPVKFDYAVSPASPNLTATALPTICAGCRGDITVTYDMRGGAVYGRVGHKINLWVNGKKETFGITTTAIVVDRFAPGDTTDIPRMKLVPAFADLEEMSADNQTEVEFTITNEGSRTLIVRAVQPRKSITTDLTPGIQIAPGGEFKVKAVVNASGDKGSFFADGIYITTNDPTAPMKEFRVMGKIK